MRQTRAGRRRERERGASLVEFALIVPLLTLFLFGIVQFGIAYDKKQSTNSSAREGARTASLPQSNFAAIDASARSAFEGLDDDQTLTVSVTNSANSYSESWDGSGSVPATGEPCKNVPGSVVVVEVETVHTLTIPFFGAPDITLTGHGEFRCEEDIS